jgi:hypothetical protein
MRYLVILFMVFVAINVAILTADDAETLEFGFATPTYRATVHVTALPEGFNEVVNVNIDNFDRVQDALDGMWEFWEKETQDTPTNDHYSDSIQTNNVVIYPDRATPTPGNNTRAFIDIDGFYVTTSFTAGSYFAWRVYDWKTEPAKLMIEAVPTSETISFFGTPFYTPTPLTSDTPAVGEIIVYATAGPEWVTPVPTLNPATPLWAAGSIGGFSAPDIVGTPPVNGSIIQFDDDAWYIYTPIPTIAPPTAVATPTPEIDAWGTATPIANAGDVRWNTDYQVMEYYRGDQWEPLHGFPVAWNYYGDVSGSMYCAPASAGGTTQFEARENMLIYKFEIQTNAGSGASGTYEYEVRVDGTPLPLLELEIGESDRGDTAYGYYSVDSGSAITIYVKATGPTDQIGTSGRLHCAWRP